MKREDLRSCSPTMTLDYGSISDTAKTVVALISPQIAAYIDSIADQIAGMDEATPFVIADYGSADGANSSELMETTIERIRSINRSLGIRIIYVDIADRAPFERFWRESKLSRLDRVEASYLRRSFYEPLPEAERSVHLEFSSTALHWLNTKNADQDFFRHPEHIQANQLPTEERARYAAKWREDLTSLLCERARELVRHGALFLANLADLGDDCWPASAGYDYLRDICRELHREDRISADELNAVFIPDYFATPDEMKLLMNNDRLKRRLELRSFRVVTAPCAYFAQAKDRLESRQTRAELADRLSRAVRAWSETSVKAGLSPSNRGMIEEIYRRLRDKFTENPKALPYQYCLIELRKI